MPVATSWDTFLTGHAYAVAGNAESRRVRPNVLRATAGEYHAPSFLSSRGCPQPGIPSLRQHSFTESELRQRSWAREEEHLVVMLTHLQKEPNRPMSQRTGAVSIRERHCMVYPPDITQVPEESSP